MIKNIIHSKSIEISDGVSLENVEKYLKEGTEITFSVGYYCKKASTIVKAFNSNPNVESLLLMCYSKIDDDDFPEKINSNLKSIWNNTKNPYKFFNAYLKENSITEYVENSLDWSEQQGIDKSEFKKFLMLQKSIETIRLASPLLSGILYEIDKTNFTSINFAEGSGRYFTVDIFGMFPNLKILETRTTQKLEGFARFVPKLEELSMKNHETSDICELGIEISNENLKVLKIGCSEGKIFTCEETLLEILKIFPNLEKFKIDSTIYEDEFNVKDNSRANENFLMKLNEMKKLRGLKLKNLLFQQSSRFKSLTDQIVELSKKSISLSIKVEFFALTDLENEIFLHDLKEFQDSDDGKNLNVSFERHWMETSLHMWIVKFSANRIYYEYS